LSFVVPARVHRSNLVSILVFVFSAHKAISGAMVLIVGCLLLFTNLCPVREARVCLYFLNVCVF